VGENTCRNVCDETPAFALQRFAVGPRSALRLYLGVQTTWYLLEYTTLLFDLYPFSAITQDYAKRSYLSKHFSPCSEYRVGALRRFLGNDCRLRASSSYTRLRPLGKESAALRDGPLTASK
jgi:hypothetical protein